MDRRSTTLRKHATQTGHRVMCLMKPAPQAERLRMLGDALLLEFDRGSERVLLFSEQQLEQIRQIRLALEELTGRLRLLQSEISAESETSAAAKVATDEASSAGDVPRDDG